MTQLISAVTEMCIEQPLALPGSAKYIKKTLSNKFYFIFICNIQQYSVV